MAGVNGQTPQKYPTGSFQQLMAQRYPQPAGGNNVGMPQQQQQQQRMMGSPPNQRQPQQQPQQQQQQMNPQQYNLQQQQNSNQNFQSQQSQQSQQQRPMGSPQQNNLFASNLPSASSSKATVATAASAASARSSAGSSKQTKPSSTTTTSQKRDSASRHHSAAAAVVHVSGIAFNTPDQKQNLSQIDWKDKVLWGTRLILGGNSVNGFLRATATAQRIKKQRARQMIITKKAAAAAAGGPPPTAAAAEHNNNDDHKKDKSNKQVFDQEEEEKLKQDIMNPRTAKKIKAEMEAGVQFCATVHNILRSAIFEIALEQTPYLPKVLQVPDHPIQASSAILIPTPMSHATPQQGWTLQPQQQQASSSSSSLMMTHHDSSMPWAVKSNAGGPMGAFHFASKIPRSGPRPMSSSSLLLPPANKTTASPGNPEGSTLRKMRRKRLPPSNNDEPRVQLPELDGSGKRLCTKKEHHYRLFELLRFRPLRQGDFVAARLTSRDLWILAKVQNKDYPGIGMAPLDFLKLSGTRRDAVFREKVLVKDVEEKEDGGSAQVARSLTLPLPRTHSEAAEWGQRIKKGSRVYAMYPQTTSLYSATVIDSTTYCRDMDDIIVVEFDGEEHDATGQVPKYHIPARFVTLIPREFPASQGNPAAAANKTNKRKGTPLQAAPQAKRQQTVDDIFGMDFGDNLDALDLDFDKPLGADEVEDDFPPIF